MNSVDDRKNNRSYAVTNLNIPFRKFWMNPTSRELPSSCWHWNGLLMT